MKKIIIITYGTFDLFHSGHSKILARAKALGDYLIVAVSSDEFNKLKGKKAFDSFERRKWNVEQSRFADLIIIENNWEQKIHDIKHYEVDMFVMGGDWKGKFDEFKSETKVIYLPRTKFISSTKLRKKLEKINCPSKSGQ